MSKSKRLPNRKSHGTKPKGKTSIKKTASRTGKSNQSKSVSRKDKTPTGYKTGKKSTQKNKANISKVQKSKSVSQRSVRKGSYKTQPKTGGRLITEKRQRNKEQTDFHFEGVRNVFKKIDTFKQQAKPAIKNQLQRKGGKPPRGFIVTVYDKKGREKTEKTPLDFVVNENSIQEFIESMLERMAIDFEEWKDMEDEPGEDTDDNPYNDFNPDTIEEISIKYIY